MIPYTPQKIQKPTNLVEVPSAWRGLESILSDILERFKIGRGKAIEFGVEYGYSTVALSNFFEKVVGVDTFEGDKHTHDHVEGLYEAVKELLAPYPIELIKSRYQDFDTDERFDLAHVDIVHTYEDTYACGEWSMKHADIVLFHDTESFPDVKRAVNDLCQKYGWEFYNYPKSYGLGICIKSQ